MANDFQLADDPKEIQPRTKARVTAILLLAFIAFYGMYIVHEWSVGRPFDMTGRFLENGLVMFLGWCLGKQSSKRGQP